MRFFPWSSLVFLRAKVVLFSLVVGIFAMQIVWELLTRKVCGIIKLTNLSWHTSHRLSNCR